jgi:RNA polymerase sigma-70 factor (ECF subfamily)
MIDWDDIMSREGPAVWRTAYRLLRNRADADECFQEAFLAALTLSGRQTVRNWTALLQRLATSRAIDRLRQRVRRQRREEPAELALSAGAEDSPSQRIEAEELASSLRWAVTQLPERQAEAFCLNQLGDWSHQQIAEQFGMTANAVGVMLHRTKQKLQELLQMKGRVSAALGRQRGAQRA